MRGEGTLLRWFAAQRSAVHGVPVLACLGQLTLIFFPTGSGMYERNIQDTLKDAMLWYLVILSN